MPDPIPEWSPAEADVIARELVACTLGQRQRIELRLDMLGALSRVGLRLQEYATALRGLFVVTAASARAAAAIRADLDRIRREDTQP